MTNKQRSANTFYPILHTSKEALEKISSEIIGKPVWDDIKHKTNQIGIVTDATAVDDEKMGKGICLTIELLDKETLSKLNKNLPRGISLGGNIKHAK